MTSWTAMLAILLAMSQPAQAPAVPPADNASASAGDPASTAVRLRDLDTRMTVAVTIDGAGPFRFIVDSGATRTVISRRLATLLGLPSAGLVPLHSVGGESEVDSVRIESLTLGTLSTGPIIAPVLEEDNLGAAGILGIDALRNGKVVIDLVANRMTVLPADRVSPPPASNEIVVTARRRYGQLVLADADALGEHVYAVVDTGSMITIGNGTLQARLVRHKRATPQSTVITDVTGRQIQATYAPIHNLRIGNWHVSNMVVAFSDAHAFARFGLSDKPAMLLGMDMMRAFRRVSIDFRRRTVRLLRASDEDGPTMTVGPATR